MPLTRALSVEEKSGSSHLGDSSQSASNIRRKSCTQRGECHVHFQTSGLKEESEGEITTNWRLPDVLDVQLGFLQLYHKYEVAFQIPRTGLKSTHISSETGNGKGNVRIISTVQSEDGCSTEILMEIFVPTDVNMKEKCDFTEETVNGHKNLTIYVTAQVLSKDKGTPLLKRGIHCIGHDEEVDDLSFSEAQFLSPPNVGKGC